MTLFRFFWIIFCRASVTLPFRTKGFAILLFWLTVTVTEFVFAGRFLKSYFVNLGDEGYVYVLPT